MKKKTILIAAAGTSGHIRPAWIIAKQADLHGFDVVWVGSKRDAWRPSEDWPRIDIDIQGVRNQGWKRWLELPYVLVIALRILYRAMKTHKPDCVVLMGGYITVPVAVVAYILDIPYVIFEQNTVLGFSNRLVLPFAHAGFGGLPFVTYNPKLRAIGNPLPEWVHPVDNIPHETMHILIFGGSQGARSINTLVPECLLDLQGKCSIVHITGRKHLEETQSIYKALGLEARCFEYVDDMEDLYTWSDLVIGRSGAMTVSELLALRKPSIVLPYPYAADNHQWHNAQWLCALGGTFVIEENSEFKKNMQLALRRIEEEGVLADMVFAMTRSNNSFSEEIFWHEMAQCIEA